MSTSTQSSSTETKARFTGRQRLGLTVVAAAVGLDASNVGVVNTALPRIQDALHISTPTLQWIVTAYAVAFAGLLLFGGRLADVLSRRLVFATGLGVFALGAVGAAVAPGIVPLIVARAVQGIGGALSMPASTALLFDIFPAGPARNKALGIFTSIASGSFSGGLVFGGLLTGALGWRSVFVFTAVIACLALAGTRIALPPGTTHRRSLDLPGAVAVTAGLALVVFAVSHGADAGWSAASTVITLVLGVLLLVAFLVREATAAEPLLPLGILRSVPVFSATVTAFVSFAGVIGVVFFTPLYMQDMLEFTPIESALALLALTVAVFGAATPTAKLLTRGVSKQKLMIAGLLLIFLGLASFIDTPLTGSYWLHLFPGLLVVGAGVGMSGASATAAGLGEVARHQQGIAGAVNATAKQVGAGIGTAALVAIVAAVTVNRTPSAVLSGYHVAYLTAAGWEMTVRQ